MTIVVIANKKRHKSILQNPFKKRAFVVFPTIQILNKTNKINRLVRGTHVAMTSLTKME